MRSYYYGAKNKGEDMLIFRLKYILLVGLGFFPVFVSAQSLHLSSETTSVSLHPHLFILSTETAGETPWLSEESTAFVPLESYDRPLLAEKDYWLRVDIEADSENYSSAEWVINFSLIPTDVSYYLVSDKVILEKGRTGFFQHVSDRTFTPSMKGSFGKILIPSGQASSLFIKTRTDRIGAQPKFNIEMEHSVMYYQKLSNKRLFNGFFLGFILLMLLYNFFLYIQFADRSFIYYTIYLLGLGTFSMYNTGYLADNLIPAFFPSQPHHIYLFKSFIYFTIIAYLFFLRYFMNLEKLLPKWDQAFIWFTRLGVLLLIVDVFIMYYTNFNYDRADIYPIVYVLLFLAVMFSFLYPLAKAKKGGKKRYFIIGGVIAMGIGIFLTVLQRIASVGYLAVWFKLGTMVELVIFSLGLTFRQRETVNESQRSMLALEKAKTKERQKEMEAKQLAALNSAKNRFYTNITHEFRTPLTVILGISDYLRDKKWESSLSSKDKQNLSDNLNLVLRNGQQLLHQVNQLLDMAKLDSGMVQLEMKHGNVIPFLAYLVASFQSLAQGKKILLSFQPEVQSLFIDHDETKWQHIIFNLLSNAIKFTPAGGEIALIVSTHEQAGQSQVIIKVKDTGIGIAKEDLDNVFERYFQVAESTFEENENGSGIGLAFTKNLVKLLGGQISVESDLGVGSTFQIILPLTRDAIAVENREAKRLAEILDTSVLEETPLDSLEDTTELPQLLLVEDNQSVRIFLQELLHENYQLLIAKDGQDGVEQALKHIPDLIISDVMMPKMDGFMLTEQLKEDQLTSHIPIILLTAKADDASKISGLKKGADAYLMKPFNKEELFLWINNLLSLRNAIHEHFAQADQKTIPNTGNPIDDEFLQKLYNHVEENIDNVVLGAQDLAKLQLISVSQLYRKLKALTGQKPTEFIRNIRLNKGADLLMSTNLTISEIAFRTGFNDPNYFSRMFLKKYEASPSDYRKNR